MNKRTADILFYNHFVRTSQRSFGKIYGKLKMWDK